MKNGKNGFKLSLVTRAVLLTALVIALPAWADTFHYSPPVSKFTQPLRGVGPGQIPVAVSDGVSNWIDGFAANHYTIDISQFTDTLHPDLGSTTFWGYNPRNALGVNGVPTPKYLGGIIVAQKGTPVQITFRNNLPNTAILPVDNSIMGAEAGVAVNRTSTHLHGGLVPWISDGGPNAWWDPQGGKGIDFIQNAVLRPGQNVPANEAEYYYPNNQSARLVWYHDHAIGITRLNAYAGIASAFIIRDSFEAGLVANKGLPQFIEKGGTHELPLIIQDKIFQNANDPDPAFPGKQGAGNLWYPYIYDPNR